MTTKRKRVNEYNKWEKDHGTHNSEVQNCNRMKLWIQWYHEALFVTEKTSWLFLPDASFDWHWELLGWLQPSKKSEKTWRSTSVFGDGDQLCYFFCATLMLKTRSVPIFVVRNPVFFSSFGTCTLLFGEKDRGKWQGRTFCALQVDSSRFCKTQENFGKIIFWQIVSCHFIREKLHSLWFYINLLP